MNLLEHYIKKIISEQEVEMFDKTYVVAKLVIDCYGVIEETVTKLPKEEWEQAKKDGYYLA